MKTRVRGRAEMAFWCCLAWRLERRAVLSGVKRLRLLMGAVLLALAMALGSCGGNVQEEQQDVQEAQQEVEEEQKDVDEEQKDVDEAEKEAKEEQKDVQEARDEQQEDQPQDPERDKERNEEQ